MYSKFKSTVSTLIGILAVSMLPVLAVAQQPQIGVEQLERYKALSPEQRQKIREIIGAEQAAHLDRLLGGSNQASGGNKQATITAGVPTRLTYTVVVQNLSGVPVVDPVVKDNGNILKNDEAVKTGGNQDHVLDVGETWTWTYHVDVTGKVGEKILNSVTVQGPDDQNRDSNPGNNSDGTEVVVLPPPGNYDLSVTKSVSTSDQSGPGGLPSDENTEKRDDVLDQCNAWKQAQSGGYLGTKDTWDIGTLPQGTTFDIRYDALSVPDRYVVQYPAGVTVFDSGWRGSQSRLDQKAHLYPGGLAGPGKGEKMGLFTKGASNSMVVIVYGPEEGTRWHYEVRANCP
nr:hypothetical protein [uncultured Dethiosulfovibrio sp.]